jgi:hypothetical protein
MRKFIRVRSTASITTLAAGILLLAAAQGASAGNHDGNGGGHHGGNNSGQGTGGEARRTNANPAQNNFRPIVAERRGGDKFDRKSTTDRGDRTDRGGRTDRGDKYRNAQDHKHEKWGRDRERLGDGKQKMTAPVGKPVETTGAKPPQTDTSKPVASTSASPTGVTPPANTIHPIPSSAAGNVPTAGNVTTGPGSITVSGEDAAKTFGKVTLGGAAAVGVLTIAPPIAAGIGLAKDGVKGAVNGVEHTVEAVYDFFSW